MHQPVLATVSSNTCNQMHVQIKHSLAHLQNLISTFTGMFAYVFYQAKQGYIYMLENTLFVHAFCQMCLSTQPGALYVVTYSVQLFLIGLTWLAQLPASLLLLRCKPSYFLIQSQILICILYMQHLDFNFKYTFQITS